MELEKLQSEWYDLNKQINEVTENMDKIFNPFYTSKEVSKGTGLGLSLSYDIVQAHGGELKVETKENEGTEFNISLPYTTVPNGDILDTIPPKEYSYNEHIEKIFIEFSDIYFNYNIKIS